MPQTHLRTCHLCEALCGVVIETEGREVLSVRGDEHDPFSHGHICPKAAALGDLHADPDRLRQPLRKGADGQHTPVSWDAAFAEIAERLGAIRREHGRHAAGIYIGNPTVHDHGLALYGLLLAQRLGTHHRYSANSVDAFPHLMSSLQMFGHQLMMPIPDLERAQFLLMFGANPLVSNGSIMSAPDVRKRLGGLKARGGALWVVDPRRSETARIADRHLFIRPNRDALLLAALVREIGERGWARPGRLASHMRGFERLPAIVEPFTPEAVSDATGISAQTIRELAQRFAEAEVAVCYGRLGISTQYDGALTSWLINVLNAMTGNLDRPGGAMFTTPAVDVLAVTAKLGEGGSYDRWRTRVRGAPEFSGEAPVATMAEEILEEGEGRLRALITVAGNPVLSTPNGRRLDEALSQLELMVSVDPYLNETTRHADFILPPASPLARDQYDLVFNALAIRNRARYNPPIFPKEASALHDWEILDRLRRGVAPKPGAAARQAAKVEDAVAARLGPTGIVGLGIAAGPWGLRRGLHALSLRQLRKRPRGVDLGPLEPCLPGRLSTPDGKIDMTPEVFVNALRELQGRLESGAMDRNGALELIGRRQLRSNNSWMHNCKRLMKGKDRCTLLMHPEDAQARGLEAGQRVRLSSRVGAIEVPLVLSDEMMPGVVSLPHGFGHGRDGVKLGVASAHAGESINDVSDEMRIDPVVGTAAFNGTPVQVEALSAG